MRKKKEKKKGRKKCCPVNECQLKQAPPLRGFQMVASSLLDMVMELFYPIPITDVFPVGNILEYGSL